MRVVVAGAGPAGLSAALEAQASGHAVTLVERRGLLGGRAARLEDAASGESVGGPSPVLLQAWTAARGLWERAGLADRLSDARSLDLDEAARTLLARAAADSRGAGHAPLLWRGAAPFDALRERFVEGGGQLLTGARVERLLVDEGARVVGLELTVRRGGRDAIVRGRAREADALDAEAVVLALPSYAILPLLPAARRAAAAELGGLAWHPSSIVELWFEEPLTSRLVLSLEGGFAWALDRPRLDAGVAGPRDDGAGAQRLTLYAASDAAPRPNAAWVEAGLASLRAAGCPVPPEGPLRSLVLREPRAVPASGLDPDALADRIAIEALALAGDWADPEWFGTLEGAVRSGQRAVRRLRG